eukprot:TRINITY_DN20169_c0_g1_i1.p1 TRINITY_DN20169_c0_g1~~TRINITY_DN20169_c0_g1_i1.p1  ORF type:complete len:487 (+),score=127.82 TRINITY_DN20169_c0_g1_i1:168-1628(+)
MESVLRDALACALSGHQPQRGQGEQKLQQLSQDPSFCKALCDVVLGEGEQPPQRKMAAVVLRQFAAKQWHTVPPETQNTIRDVISGGLKQPDGELRNTIAAVVATIAFHDWPTRWPDIVTALFECFSGVHGQEAAMGSISAIHELVSIMGLPFEQLSNLVPQALARAMQTLASQNFPEDLRCQAGSLALTCVRLIWEKELNDPGMIQEVINLVNATLTQEPSPKISAEATRIGCEILRCEPEYTARVLLPTLTTFYANFLPQYLGYQLRGCAVSGIDDLLDLLLLVIELLIALTKSEHMAQCAPQITRAAVGYLVLAREMENLYGADVDQYQICIADEITADPTEGAVRTQSQLLLQLLVDEPGAVAAGLEAGLELFENGTKLQAAADPRWWVQCEAVMQALGVLLGDAKQPLTTPPEWTIRCVCAGVVSHQLPLLWASGMWCGSKLVAAEIRPVATQDMFNAGIKGLTEGPVSYTHLTLPTKRIV